MKKILNLGLVVIALLITQSIFAQRNMDSRMDQLTKELNLTAEQTAQLEKIFEARKGDHEKLRNQEFENREDRRTAMKAQRESMHKEIETVLTKEQLEKFNELRQERGKRGFRDGKGKHAGKHPRMEDGQRKAFHNEMKAYKDENILPVMKTQRAKLESKITAEDKQLIAEMRVEVLQRKEEGRKRQEARDNDSKQKDGSREKGKGQNRKNFKDKDGNKEKRRHGHHNPEKREQMKSLVEKYSDDIQPLFDEVANEQAKWEKDIKAISEKFKKEGNQERAQRFEDRKEKHGERMAKMKMAKFLLLDPNAPIENSKQSSLVSKFSVYPNPATAQSTLEYELLENGKVLIELRDTEGNLLKTLENSEKSAGKHQLTIDLQDYKTNVYYIVIKDKNGIAKTKNLVRVK